MKEIKYYAGLIDADGSFTLKPYKTELGYVVRSQFKLELKQSSRWILCPLAEEFSVPINNQTRVDKRTGKSYSSVYIYVTADKCLRLMEQCKQHLVIKNPVVESLIKFDGRVVDKRELKQVRQYVKHARDCLTPTHKTKVGRQWMAGYIDGDGYIGSSFREKDGNLSFKLVVASHKNDPQGVLLLHETFGGYIVYGKTGNNCMWWGIHLGRSNCEKVFSHFIQHLKLKRKQADLVLSELRKREKYTIKSPEKIEHNRRVHETLKMLKTGND